MCAEAGNILDSKSDRKSNKSIGGFSSSQFKKIYTSAIKSKADEQRYANNNESNSVRNIRCLRESIHVGRIAHQSTKRRLSTVTEKSKTIIKCPICAYRTEIVIGGVTRVPKNFLLERQVQIELTRMENQNLAVQFCSLCCDKIEVIGQVEESKKRELERILVLC